MTNTPSDSTLGQPGELGHPGTAGGIGGIGGAGGTGGTGSKGEPGDNSKAIKVTDRRLLFIMGLVVLVSTVLGVRGEINRTDISHDRHTQDLRNYFVCQQAVSLTFRINSFANTQIALEKTNKFIDQKFRNERVVLFRDLLTVPKTCGAKP